MKKIIQSQCDNKFLLLAQKNLGLILNFQCIAVVAPGGSNFLISGTILIDMNIMNLPNGKEKDYYDMKIGALCLFGNGLTSAYNLLGVCNYTFVFLKLCPLAQWYSINSSIFC